MKEQGTPADGPARPVSVSARDPSARPPSLEHVDHTVVDWYCHDPDEGRVGPYSAEDLRKRYRDRRIQRDTLVWRHGLREWQPLDRVSDEVGIDDVVPNPLPATPPLPGGGADEPGPPARTAGTRGKYARQPLKPRRTLPIWAIVLIAACLLSIPAFGILGSIMLPAYQDYAEQAETSARLTGAGAALTRRVSRYYAARGACPTMSDPQVAEMAGQLSARMSSRVRFGQLAGGYCVFELTLRHDRADADGKTLRYVGWRQGDDFVWDCSEGSLPDAYRPAQCMAGDVP